MKKIFPLMILALGLGYTAVICYMNGNLQIKEQEVVRLQQELESANEERAANWRDVERLQTEVIRLKKQLNK